MTITFRRPFVSIGPQQARFEAGWFRGMSPSLIRVTVLEWQQAADMPQLSYLCLLDLQILKFVIDLTFFPHRSSANEYPFGDPVLGDCMNSNVAQERRRRL